MDRTTHIQITDPATGETLTEWERDGAGNRVDEHADIDEIARECAIDSRRWFPHLYETTASALTHMTLGLAGEAGEVANLVKKANRSGRLDDLTVFEADAIAEELTDVLLYALLAMNTLGRRPAAWINRKRIYNEDRFGHTVGHAEDRPTGEPA